MALAAGQVLLLARMMDDALAALVVVGVLLGCNNRDPRPLGVDGPVAVVVANGAGCSVSEERVILRLCVLCIQVRARSDAPVGHMAVCLADGSESHSGPLQVV